MLLRCYVNWSPWDIDITGLTGAPYIFRSSSASPDTYARCVPWLSIIIITADALQSRPYSEKQWGEKIGVGVDLLLFIVIIVHCYQVIDLKTIKHLLYVYVLKGFFKIYVTCFHRNVVCWKKVMLCLKSYRPEVIDPKLGPYWCRSVLLFPTL